MPVTYGEWTQLADYEAQGTQKPYVGGGAATARVLLDSARSGDAKFDLQEILDVAHGAALEPASGETQGQLVATLPISPAPDNFREGRHSLGARLIGPVDKAYYHTEMKRTYYGIEPPTQIVPPAPEGATGYEWAAPKGTLLDCWIILRDHDCDASITGSVVATWTAQLGAASGQPGMTVPLRYSASAMTERGGVDTTTWTDGNNTPKTGSFNVPTWDVTTGYFQLMGDVLSLTIESAEYSNFAPGTGYSVTLRLGISELVGNIAVRYTVRPPLFRWVYGEPDPTTTRLLPPLRQRQRSDGLRGSSAPRHYPPPPSRQASNRHRGGYD